VLRADFFVRKSVADTTGTLYPATSSVKIARQYIPLPPLSEQRAIAAYLDKFEQLAQQLARRLERQLELVQELHRSVVSDAVSRGARPGCAPAPHPHPVAGGTPREMEGEEAGRCSNYR